MPQEQVRDEVLKCHVFRDVDQSAVWVSWTVGIVQLGDDDAEENFERRLGIILTLVFEFGLLRTRYPLVMRKGGSITLGEKDSPGL